MGSPVGHLPAGAAPLSDPMSSTGKINVKDDELDAMLKEATGPINFTMFLNMFGEKLSGEPSGLGQAACVYLEMQTSLIQIWIFRSPEKPWDPHVCPPHLSYPSPLCPSPASHLPQPLLPGHVPSSGPGRDTEHRCPRQGLQGARCLGGWDGPPGRWHRVMGTQAARAGVASLWAGTDTEETILNAFKMLDPDGKGSVNKD